MTEDLWLFLIAVNTHGVAAPFSVYQLCQLVFMYERRFVIGYLLAALRSMM